MEGKKKLRTGGPARHRWIFPAAAPLPATQVSSKTSRQQTSLTNPTKSWHALPWNGLLCAKVLFIYWYFFFEEAPQRHSTMNPWTHLVGLLWGVFFFPKRTAWPRLAFLQPPFMVKLLWDLHDFNICGPRCPRFPTLRNHCRGLKSPDETFPNRLQWGPSKCAREGALRSSPETESAELFEMLPNRRPSASHVAVLLKLGIFWNIFSWGRVKMRHLIPRVPV